MKRRTFSALLLAGLLMPGLFSSAFASGFANYEAGGFRKLLASGVPVVVHVHADWCPVCRAQIPVMERVLKGAAYKNVRAVRVNFDRDKAFLSDYKIVRQSTIVVFKAGKEVARLSYDTDPARIEEVLEWALP
jgi:thioredoxin 1